MFENEKKVCWSIILDLNKGQNRDEMLFFVQL